MSTNQFTTTRLPDRTIPLVTTPTRRAAELLIASVLGAALALFAAWLLFTPAPRSAVAPPVPAPILIMATAQLPTAQPTPTATATAIPTEEPTQERAPGGRSEPLPQDAPAQVEAAPGMDTVPAICYTGCDGGIGPVDQQPPDPLTMPTSEVYCTAGCNQVWGPTTAPAPQGPAPTPVQADAICPPAPCPDPPDLTVAATIAAFKK